MNWGSQEWLQLTEGKREFKVWISDSQEEVHQFYGEFGRIYGCVNGKQVNTIMKGRSGKQAEKETDNMEVDEQDKENEDSHGSSSESDGSEESSASEESDSSGSEESGDEEDGVSGKIYTGLKFRNYNARDTKLRECKMAIPNEESDIVVELAQQFAQLAEVKGENIINLAPKKPDWDLKRDIGPKLEKLERMTELAILDLIQDKLDGKDIDKPRTTGVALSLKGPEAAEEID